MISERHFAENHSSFWKELFPLSHLFIKNANQKAREAENGIEIKAEGKRMSFISQLAFLVLNKVLIDKNDISTCFEEKYFSHVEELARLQFKQYDDYDQVAYTINNIEKTDIQKLSEAMISFFSESKHITISPKIRGCGIIDNCYADVLADETLWEIKCVNRAFKMTDYKQVFVYVALNSLSRQHTIKKLGLYNPRNGTYYTIGIQSFAKIISGREPNELYTDLINYITMENPSK